MEAVYKRIIIKLSGEILAGNKAEGEIYDPAVVDKVTDAIIEIEKMGVEVGVVVGGGNIWRGRNAAKGMDAVTADHMGMLATVLNGLYLQDALERKGADTRLQTAIEMRQVAELFIRRRAERHLEKRRIVIFAAGTGNPHFSTDTAAALRAAEMKADAILKGTTVDALYDSDPHKNPNAKRISDITYQGAIEKQLHVMDTAAFALCQERNIPQIRIFSLDDPQNMVRVVRGEPIGTVVHN